MNKEFLYYLNSIIGKEKDKLITQEKLAKSVECTTVSMSRYLSGQREIPVDILFKMIICQIKCNIHLNTH